MTKLQGIDLSRWNTVPDYEKLSNCGLAFAYVKASEAGFRDDTYTEKHGNLLRSGLLCGSYHFFKAGIDPILQAKVFLETIGGLVPNGELPPVLDIEDPADKLTVAQYENVVSEWLGYVEKATGTKPIIYTGGWYWEQLKTLGNTSKFKDYPLWLSSYTPTYGKMFGGWAAPIFWQYTSKGSIAGMDSVDMDYFYGSVSDLWALARMQPLAISSANEPKTKAMQKRLTNLGLYSGPIDGAYGQGTVAAITDFQQHKQLPANGLLDTETWAELFGVTVL